jgi:hypothetical protein
MANTTSGSYVFDKNLSIDEIIEDAYERIGMQGTAGHQLKTARRSLNILFSEWGNRGLQFWEVKNQNIALVDGQAVYTFYRSPAALEGLMVAQQLLIVLLMPYYSFQLV